MKNVTISLYSFAELSRAAQERAIIDHANFLISTPVMVETEGGEMEEIYEHEYTRADVIDSIEANEYLFFVDGILSHCTHYVGNYPHAGRIEFHFHGQTFDITK